MDRDIDIVENDNTRIHENISDSLIDDIIFFLNNDGGKIYVGVTRDGTRTGVGSLDVFFRRLGDILFSCIVPSAFSLVVSDVMYDPERTVVVLNVTKGDSEYRRIDEAGTPEERERKVLAVLKNHPCWSAREVSEALSMSFRSVQRYIASLRDKGIMKKNDVDSHEDADSSLDDLSVEELKKMNRDLRKKSAYLEDKVLYLETLYKLITEDDVKNK